MVEKNKPIDASNLKSSQMEGVAKSPISGKSKPVPETQKKKNKKRKIIIAVVVIIFVLLIGIATAAYFWWTAEPETEPEVVLIEEEDETPIEQVIRRRLDGVIVDKQFSNPYPRAVIIENYTTVRPQSGLAEAGVVYETLAEGGITRFLAIFAGNGQGEVGPVRSARPYFLEWVSEYDALYAHIGGSPEALEAIDGLGIYDLNAMYEGSKYFFRVNYLPAPHNLYTTQENLALAIRDYDLEDKEADYEMWKFKDEASYAERGDGIGSNGSNEIQIDFSSENYSVSYQYDKENNAYLRFNGGKAHEDKNTGMQLAPKNVIINVIPPVVSIGDKGRLTLDVNGTGKAFIFRDGEIIKGSWEKPERESRTVYYNESGEQVELNAGQTFIEVVPSDRELSF